MSTFVLEKSRAEMRKALSIAILAVLLTVNGSQNGAFGDDLSTNRTEQNTTTERRVASGVETMVARTFAWRSGRQGSGLCSEYYIPALQIVDPPQHGTARIDSILAIPRGSGCSNPIHGQGVFYRSVDSYVGQDQLTFYRPNDPMAFNWVGGVPPGNRTVVITVRPR
jgi:hypothetical protein